MSPERSKAKSEVRSDGGSSRLESDLGTGSLGGTPSSLRAIAEMDKAMGALRYELPGVVWEDVNRRYLPVRALAAWRTRVLDAHEATVVASGPCDESEGT